MQEINYNLYGWGPLLLQTKVSDEYCNQILDFANSTRTDHRSGLASLIDNAFKFSESNKIFIFDLLKDYFKCFIDINCQHLALNGNKIPTGLAPGDFWINYQQSGEFNPSHVHSLDISFALCLDMPLEVVEENKHFVGKSSGPGALSFHYGELLPWTIHTQQFLPSKGDIFIFPAGLRHTVYPFKSNATRISLSGNLEYLYD